MEVISSKTNSSNFGIPLFERIKARVHFERRDCIIYIHHREKKSIKSYKVVGKI